MSDLSHYRNIGIFAHVDAGKTTTTERILKLTGKIHKTGEVHEGEATTDFMDQERERGITIQSAATSCEWNKHRLNIIDTPGHVDFTYEVSRALAACEGALLLIDASQGVEAQTLANLYLAVEHNLEIIPVINKIDLPSADIDRVLMQIEEDLGLDPEKTLQVSAKQGLGIEQVLETIVRELPPPDGDANQPLQALIFDSHYDSYRGTVVHLRIFSGQIKPGDTIIFTSNQAAYRVEEVGVFQLERIPIQTLSAGQVGYIIAGIKKISDTRCGDTVTHKDQPCDAALPGFKVTKPVVFSSIYPTASDGYEELAVAMEKLSLNDAALVYEKDSSAALGGVRRLHHRAG